MLRRKIFYKRINFVERQLAKKYKKPLFTLRQFVFKKLKEIVFKKLRETS